MRLRILVVTVVHDPEDARIRYRQIPALLQAGHRIAYAAPFSAFNRTPPGGVRAYDVPRAKGRARLHAVRAARRLIARIGPMVDVVLVQYPDILLSLTAQSSQSCSILWFEHTNIAVTHILRSLHLLCITYTLV